MRQDAHPVDEERSFADAATEQWHVGGIENQTPEINDCLVETVFSSAWGCDMNGYDYTCCIE